MAGAVVDGVQQTVAQAHLAWVGWGLVVRVRARVGPGLGLGLGVRVGVRFRVGVRDGVMVRAAGVMLGLRSR